jgi:dihydrofolate reductase/thymidylate synthase
MYVITAFTNRSFGIGKDNKLPWSIPEDMKRFAKITKGNTVVMGRKTWESIGKRPLTERFNVVVSETDSKKNIEETSNLVFIGEETLQCIKDVIDFGNIFIIGGSHLYKRFVGEADIIYATVIEEPTYECDCFFPVEKMHEYDIIKASSKFYCASENARYSYITYRKRNTGKIHEEFQYLEMMKHILHKGEARPDRTGVGTLATFGHQLRFDISNSVPFITTKALAWKTVIRELIWFLSGSSNSKVLESQGVNIWKGNTSRDFLDKRGLKDYVEGDVGPLYSHSLRFFGAKYEGCHKDYNGKGGVDQLHNLIHGLKTDPYSRRHVMTTFNPSVVDECVLMPCHGIAIQFFVNGDENDQYLSCHVYCRSSDTFLGLPFNIASYAVLTYLIAKLCNMKPKDLVISTGDTHIYANHVEQVKTQLTRNPLPFPVLVVNNSVLSKPIEKIVLDDFELQGYVCHPTISASMAI